MPAKSRQAKAAASRVRCPTTNRFAGDKKVPAPVGQADDEYHDIDGDFHEIGEDEEEDIVERTLDETQPDLSSEFMARQRNWRPAGSNTNIRGAGTSSRTHFRNKRKIADTTLAAQKCQAIELFFASPSLSSSTPPVEAPSTISQTTNPSASSSSSSSTR